MSNRTDTFNRANSSSLGTPSDGGSAWVQTAAGVPQIDSNQCYNLTGGGGIAYLECGSADGTLQYTVVSVASRFHCIFRLTDSSNYLICYFDNGFTGFAKNVGGSLTFIGSGSGDTAGVGDIVSVEISGSSLVGKINGVSKATATDGFNSTATKCGLYVNAGGQGRIDGWSFADANAGINLAVTCPVPSQVFQRAGETAGIGGTGTILVTGQNNDSGAHTIEASFNGGSYATVASSVAGGATFSGTITGQAAGTGTLTVRFADDHAQAVDVGPVGVGEVFVVMGQSNSPGGAASYSYQSYAGLSAGLVKTGTTTWVDLSTGENAGGGGTGWNWCATNLMVRCQCPVAFLHVVHGGTGVSDWVPGAGTGYYEAAVGLPAAAKSNGCRAVLYWQGESNAGTTTQAAFYSALSSIASGVQSALGVPLVPCKLQLLDASVGSTDPINAAIAQVWSDTGVAGPDLSGIPCEPEDTVHLSTAVKQNAAGSLWWDALLGQFFEPAAGGSGGGLLAQRGFTGGFQ